MKKNIASHDQPDCAAPKEDSAHDLVQEWNFGSYHVIFLRITEGGASHNHIPQIAHALDTMVDILETATDNGVASKLNTGLVRTCATTQAKSFNLNLAVAEAVPNDPASPLRVTFSEKQLVLA